VKISGNNFVSGYAYSMGVNSWITQWRYFIVQNLSF